MIELQGLTKRYGRTVAVDDLSFAVRPGKVTGFLGPNGAGKSTSMRVILGLDWPTAGQALVDGRPYRRLREPLRVVGALLEARAVHPRRSAHDHLLALAQASGIARSRVEEVLGLVGLDKVAGRRVGGFSLGMGQRLGIAAALLGDPGIVLFAWGTVVDDQADTARTTAVDHASFGVAFGQFGFVALAALAITTEFATGSIRTTLAATPARWAVLAAKAAIVGMVTFAGGFVATVLAILAAAPILGASTDGLLPASARAAAALAERIPQVNASFVLFQSTDITRARSAFDLLNTLGNWLPVIALVLLAIGVYVARDHRRALAGAGVGVAVGMLLLALGLAVFRSIYLDAVPAGVLPHDAAAVLYDTIVRFLRAGLRTILVLGLVVAAGAFLIGQSPTAVRTRQSLAGGIGWLRSSAEGAGLRTGPVGSWVHDHRRALRIGAVVVAGLALVFWSRPTGKVIILLAVLLLVVLAVIEFLGRPPERTCAVSTTQT